MKQKTYMDKPSRQKKGSQTTFKKKLDKSKSVPENRLLDVDYTSGFSPTRRIK